MAKIYDYTLSVLGNRLLVNSAAWRAACHCRQSDGSLRATFEGRTHCGMTINDQIGHCGKKLESQNANGIDFWWIGTAKSKLEMAAASS